MPTRYERLVEVNAVDVNGVEVTLALQRRFSPSLAPWFTVSWRTRLRPGGPNRRFYGLRGIPWSIDAHLADEMLTDLDHRGGLDETYHDHVRRPTFDELDSDSLPPSDSHRIFDEITYPSEDWGDEPFWVVVGEDPSATLEAWRKIIIVDPLTGRATYRSTTKSPTYRPRAVLRDGLDWVLDNSMQDCTVQQAVALRGRLRSLLNRRNVPRWDGRASA